MRPLRVFALLIAILAMLACGADGPAHIAYDGTESCALCRMPVTDRRFASQLVTRTGKALKFDSIECLAGYVARMTAADAPRGAWVSDFMAPGRMIAAEDARFIRASVVSSPMGQGVIAVAPGGITDAALMQRFGGSVMDWTGVLALTPPYEAPRA